MEPEGSVTGKKKKKKKKKTYYVSKAGPSLEWEKTYMVRKNALLFSARVKNRCFLGRPNLKGFNPTVTRGCTRPNTPLAPLVITTLYMSP
jgi:hypothetical protein